MKNSIFKIQKYQWTPLLRFGGARTRIDASEGFHSYPLSSPRLRTMGARIKDSNGVIKDSKVAHVDTYTTFDNQAGDVVEIKYDVTKLTSLWYRYCNVSEILFDLNTAPLLEVLSFREHMIAFGALDISGLANLRKFEISSGGSIDSVTFHPSAPIDYFYLDGCTMPQSVVDECIKHAYNSNVSNGQILNGTLAPSDLVCTEYNNLIGRGWTISTAPACLEAPTAPTNLSTNEVMDGGLMLSWTAGTDSDGTIASNEIWRETNSGGFVLLTTVGDVTSYEDTSVLSGNDYSYYLVAVDNDGLKSPNSTTVTHLNYTPVTSSSTTLNAYDLQHSTTSGNACDETTSELATYYMDDTLENATVLYDDSAGTTPGPAGFYSDGVHVREWDGSNFTGTAQFCS